MLLAQKVTDIKWLGGVVLSTCGARAFVSTNTDMTDGSGFSSTLLLTPELNVS